MELYAQAFTHQSVDPARNYEFLEFLGDSTLNKSIAFYLAERFPHLQCPEGVKVLTRLKINLISRKSFAGIAETLRFWDFVRTLEQTHDSKRQKVLEDVFEAFFGATEWLVERRMGVGHGYHTCYALVSTFLAEIPISLRYEDLFDPKTRLKELFDFFRDRIGTLKYVNEKRDFMHHVSVFRVVNGREIEMGRGAAQLKVDAQQKASELAIEHLAKRNFRKDVPALYRTLEIHNE